MKRFLLLLIALVLHTAAWAHKPSDSYLTLRAADGSNNIAVRWDWLWHRPPVGPVEQAGDPLVLERLDRTIALGIS